MPSVSTAVNEKNAEPRPSKGVEGLPCVFGQCTGFYHPAPGSTGVILCAPWGFEDLTMRKSWRLLAEAIAHAGLPSLRFDYPGTGDADGGSIEIENVAEWTRSIGCAADFLRKTSGVRRFVFIGQSLGATLAVEAARQRSDVVGLRLVAPIVKGRAYLREMTATAKLVADRVGIEVDHAPNEGLSVVGFSLSTSMVESLKTLDLTRIDTLPVSDVVVFDQPDRKAAAEIIEHARRLGCHVRAEAIAPFHVMVSDATVIQPLPVNINALTDSLAKYAPSHDKQSVAIPRLSSTLLTKSFREDVIRFGPDGLLFGVLCRPNTPARNVPAFILLNRGLNSHIGWRRVSVDHARSLAAAGFTSLRIDVAGLGESGDDPARDATLIYSDAMIADIKAAVDELVARGEERIALAGVCSGAYMALAAAHADPRVTHVVAVNAQRFVWNPRESHDDVIRYGLRSIHDYVGDIRGGRALRKLFASRHRLVPALKFLVMRKVKNAVTRIPLQWRSRLSQTSMAARVYRFFETFVVNETRVSLVFSAGDPGLAELRNYFGPDGRDIAYPNVSVTIVPNADHNLTTTRASTFMLDHMIAFGHQTISSRDSQRSAQKALQTNRIVCPT